MSFTKLSLIGIPLVFCLSAISCTKELIGTVPETGNTTDVQAVSGDKSALAIIYSEGDSAGWVTGNVVLPVNGANGSNIHWTTSNSSRITAGGGVNRPTAADSADAFVSLTATVSMSAASNQKVFVLTVKNTLVSPAIQPGQVSKDTTIVYGTSAGMLLLISTDSVVVRWEQSVEPYASWTPIANTTRTYSPGILTQSTRFRAVTSNNGVHILSGYATVTVGPPVLPAKLNRPVPNPAGGYMPSKNIVVRFVPLAQGQDSVADIWVVISPSQGPGDIANAQMYDATTGLPLNLAATGSQRILFQARPKPGKTADWVVSGVDTARYVWSAYLLGTPVPQPGSTTLTTPQVTVRFVTTDQSAYRVIYYVECNDTVNGAFDTTGWKLYDTARGINLDISGGKKGIIFIARPAPAYFNEWEPSPIGRALYAYLPTLHIIGSYFNGKVDGLIDW